MGKPRDRGDVRDRQQVKHGVKPSTPVPNSKSDSTPRDTVRGITRALLWPISTVLHHLHALLTSILLFILALGPMPHHVGFVMDGNRRYARSHGQRIAKGHQQGSESLKRTLRLCLRLNIPVVSVYAFAIDNFNRQQEEVDALMKLAQDSLAEICAENGFLQKHSIRLRCIGRMDLLKPSMQAALRDMEAATAHNTRGVLNVCGPYASRDEITSSVKEVVGLVAGAELPIDSVTSKTLFAHLQSSQSAAAVSPGYENPGKLDLLIRTSNVKRLSDFMMWQADEGTQIHFVKTYWPDFGLSDMLPILLGWQQKVWLRRWGYE